jgi:hypothetical protein
MSGAGAMANLIGTTGAPPLGIAGSSLPDIQTCALADGGWITSWLVDASGTGTDDTIAVQRYFADGATDGSVVLITGVPPIVLGNAAGSTGQYAIAALANGGYQISYAVTDAATGADFSGLVLTGGNATVQSFNLVGIPQSFTFTGGGLSGLTISLVGLNGVGNEYVVPLTLGSNGEVVITASMLADFANPERLTLQVGGLANGASVTVATVAQDDWVFAQAAATHTENLAFTANANGSGGYSAVIGVTDGRAQSFQITSATAVSGAPTYSFLVTCPAALDLGSGPGSITTIGGLTYTINQDNTLTITGPIVPNANGVIAVPAALLAALGSDDANIELIASNLAQGSSVSAAIAVATPTVIAPGLYSATFDASGNAVAVQPIKTIGATPLGIANPAAPNVASSALATGGWITSWLVDSNGQGTADTIAVQQYTASGATNGALVQITDVPAIALDNAGVAAGEYAIAALANGGYVVSYAVTGADLATNFSGLVLQGTGAGAVTAQLVGLPQSLTFQGSNLAGLTISLVGTNASGATVTVPLTLGSNGQVSISASQLAGFADPERLMLQVAGLANGASVTVAGQCQDEWLYKLSPATHAEKISVTASQNSQGVYIASLGVSDGRAQSFQITAANGLSGTPAYFFVVTYAGSVNLGNNATTAVIGGLTYTLTAGNTLTITGAINADANGNIAVPAALLAMLGTQDADIQLVAAALAQGSSISATVTVQSASVTAPGLYSETFGSTGTPVAAEAVNTTGATPLGISDGRNPVVHTSALANGGWITSWLVDSNGLGTADTIAVQRFNADGSAAGGLVDITAVPAAVLGGAAGQYAIAALANGDYEVSFAVTAQAAGGYAPGLYTQTFDANGNPVGAGTMAQVLFRSDAGSFATWQVSGSETIAGGGTIGNPGTGYTLAGEGDFDGTGATDLLFQSSSGAIADWLINGTTIIGGTTLGDPGTAWKVLGTGDFNGSGTSGVLFYNAGSGAYATWDITSNAITGGGTLGTPGPQWVEKAVGDFNGDGKSDILFENANGSYAIWELNDTTIIGGGTIGNPGAGWFFKGVGDFNGDGRTDVLFENSAGAYMTWDMDGTQITGGGTLGNPGVDWSLAGIGDYAGNGISDLLFRNVNGTLAIWNLDDATVSSASTLGNPGSGYAVAATSTPQNFADMVFQNSATSAVATWEIGDGTIVGGGTLGTPGAAWTAIATGDFAGTGETDVLFENTNGTYATWVSNGSTLVGGTTLGNPGSAWTFEGTGDFNGDGKTDLLFENTTTGIYASWDIADGQIIGGGNIGVAAGYTYVATADLTGNGKSDIIFEDSKGDYAAWLINDTTITGGGTIGNPGAGWTFKGVGDFTGNGHDDLLFENASGMYASWDMNGTQIVGGGNIGNPGGTWQLAAITDLNNSGTSDLVFENAQGTFAAWYLNDTTITGGATLGGLPSGWKLA